MEFNYNSWDPVYQGHLEIKDIGNCSLEATNKLGMFYYFISRTVLGQLTVITCGPIIPDVNDLPDGYNIRVTRMEFKEDKLEKMIFNFLNDRTKKITDAKVVDYDTALEEFRDIKEFMEEEFKPPVSKQETPI